MIHSAACSDTEAFSRTAGIHVKRRVSDGWRFAILSGRMQGTAVPGPPERQLSARPEDGFPNRLPPASEGLQVIWRDLMKSPGCFGSGGGAGAAEDTACSHTGKQTVRSCVLPMTGFHSKTNS